jgi:hypothetical protein
LDGEAFLTADFLAAGFFAAGFFAVLVIMLITKVWQSETTSNRETGCQVSEFFIY